MRFSRVAEARVCFSCIAAAQRGCREACAAAGELLLLGEVVEKDEKAARNFLSHAAAMGHEKSGELMQ